MFTVSEEMKRFYEEYKWARALEGTTAEEAFEWAKMMRACDYDRFRL